jgi:formylglycine-generating enzyme required for sulfatase activity
MTNKRQFILAATLSALFLSSLLYAVEDCDTSITECKLWQELNALQERTAQLEKENQAQQNRIAELEKVLEKEKKALRPVTGFFQEPLKDGSLGPKMVWIPAGSFRMGDIQGSGDSDEKPVHSVSVSRFAMGVYEVTFAESDRFAEATGRQKPSDKGWGRGNRPVINVSWHDATAYAEWLSEQTGKLYRLPSEAEWEYAARAGTETKYWWGNEIGSNKANCYGCGSRWDNKQTAPVGSFAPNQFGLYDTVGNVWEWCADSWHGSYKGAPTDGMVWRGGDESRRVRRGGSWGNFPRIARSAYRLRSESVKRLVNNGFRVVSSVAWIR